MLYVNLKLIPWEMAGQNMVDHFQHTYLPKELGVPQNQHS